MWAKKAVYSYIISVSAPFIEYNFWIYKQTKILNSTKEQIAC